jgi:16S rRNA (cytosine1402-N4)-methyltransferase
MPVDNFSTSAPGHDPVLLAEAVAALQPRNGGLYVDATFGGGGYSCALLARADCRVIGIDRDPDAVARGRLLVSHCDRFTMLEGRFGDLESLLHAAGIDGIDGLVADLGLSSFQLDDAARGFSFAKDGPLDMRMERGGGQSAADLVNAANERELARILREYGDEPRARRIAHAIVEQRRTSPLLRTSQLRALVARVKGGRGGRIDPATQTFQALRMAVNDEPGELERLLEASVRQLRPGGRLVVVSFHSGEDRAVKRFIDRESGRGETRSRHLPPAEEPVRRLAWVRRSTVKSGAEEVGRNPRARSARMRVAERCPAGSATGEAEDEHWDMMEDAA